MNTNIKLTNDLCLVSRQGTCLLDMQQVVEKAQQLGLRQLADLVAKDLEDNRITNGEYYPIVAGLYGVQS